jgi:hypothetical protein
MPPATTSSYADLVPGCCPEFSCHAFRHGHVPDLQSCRRLSDAARQPAAQIVGRATWRDSLTWDSTPCVIDLARRHRQARDSTRCAPRAPCFASDSASPCGLKCDKLNLGAKATSAALSHCRTLMGAVASLVLDLQQQSCPYRNGRGKNSLFRPLAAELPAQPNRLPHQAQALSFATTGLCMMSSSETVQVLCSG